MHHAPCKRWIYMRLALLFSSEYTAVVLVVDTLHLARWRRDTFVLTLSPYFQWDHEYLNQRAFHAAKWKIYDILSPNHVFPRPNYENFTFPQKISGMEKLHRYNFESSLKKKSPNSSYYTEYPPFIIRTSILCVCVTQCLSEFVAVFVEWACFCHWIPFGCCQHTKGGSFFPFHNRVLFGQ